MRTIILTVTLLAAHAVLAQDAPPLVPFPDDYKPSPCAPNDTCQSFERGRMANAGHAFYGFAMDSAWVEAHWDEMMAAFKPVCAKGGTCFAIHGATFQFCNDLLMPDFRAACNRFEKGSRDWEQCTMFVETWAIGRDQRMLPPWKEAQACAEKKTPFQPSAKPPVVWMVPPKLDLAFKDYIRIFAVDQDTHLPVPGRIFIDGQRVYAPANASGMLWTYYPWKWPVKFNRAPNAEGHRDMVAPMVTLKPEGYPEVAFRMPIEVPKVKVEMTPAADQLKRGKNTVTVTAVDAATGKPVELRVMYGKEIAGDSNKPFTLELKRNEKRREIWATSLFDWYSDVVIAPAAK